MPGGTYFFTLVTYRRQNWLCTEVARAGLREAITKTRVAYPFTMDAFVLLPNHLHCIWTLPKYDSDYATRWRLIKTYFTKNYADKLELNSCINASRQKRQEKNLWQRRFWEHVIRDEEDFTRHCDYIHYNPVKHGLCDAPQQWQYSSFHRFVSKGFYAESWGHAKITMDLPHTIERMD